MSAAPVKSEPGSVKLEDDVKVEPGLSPSDVKAEMYEDDELYEDAGDLDVAEGVRAVWLVKLPAFLAERWKDIDEDEEIVLGTVKVDQNSPDQKNLKLFLNKNAINGEDIPAEYDLNITNMEVTNTYVFTEKDMPGYENKLETGVKAGDPAMPARFLYQNKQREQKTNGDSPGASDKKSWKGRYQPYVRKAIPKQTALVGTAKHECAVLPVYNEEYRNFQAKRTKQQDAPKFSTQRIDQADVAGNLLAPGTTGVAAATSFSTFVKPTQPVRKTNENKSFRIAKEDLLTMLFDFFAQHEYWTMKGLRQMTNQPEAYLKEVLEELALLHKSGPFTGKWSLRPEYQQASADRAAFGNATEGGGYGGASGSTDPIQIDDDDDDEDEVEMEDVPLGSQPGGPQQK